MVKVATQKEISDLIGCCSRYYNLVKIGECVVEKAKALSPERGVDSVIGYEIIDNKGKSSYYVLVSE